MKKLIRLTEQDLHRIVKESVVKIINEINTTNSDIVLNRNNTPFGVICLAYDKNFEKDKRIFSASTIGKLYKLLRDTRKEFNQNWKIKDGVFALTNEGEKLVRGYVYNSNIKLSWVNSQEEFWYYITEKPEFGVRIK